MRCVVFVTFWGGSGFSGMKVLSKCGESKFSFDTSSLQDCLSMMAMDPMAHTNSPSASTYTGCMLRYLSVMAMPTAAFVVLSDCMPFTRREGERASPPSTTERVSLLEPTSRRHELRPRNPTLSGCCLHCNIPATAMRCIDR